MPQKMIIDLNNIIPSWDYIKIIESLIGKKYGNESFELYTIDPQIKFFGEFRVPLNFPYQCTFEQMGSGSILRDFDRHSGGGGLFFIEKRIIPGVPAFGWWEDIEQMLWMSPTCRWGIVECCQKFSLHIKAGTETENETLTLKWQEMVMEEKERKKKIFIVVVKGDDKRYNFYSPERGLFTYGPFESLAEAEILRGKRDGEIYELRKTKYIVFDTLFGRIKIKEDWICEYPLPRKKF